MPEEAAQIAFASAGAQAKMIRESEISAVEALEASVAMYEKFNPSVNAVVVTQLELAFDDARQADAELSRGVSRGPLHGVPATIKESFDWVGVPTTVGDPAFTSNLPLATATAVMLLQDAGAIVYGKTNVPLHLAEAQSFNTVYGTTNNPWAFDRVPGGSSGGSAAALASGMSAVELGSDIAGSLRNPAHYCGVFSHKPTFGLVPNAGHGLPGTFADMDIQVVGPMARSAADLDITLRILAGANYRRVAGARTLADFKVGVVLDSPFLTQDPELTEQLMSAIGALAEAGLDVRFEAVPDMELERAFDVNTLLLRATTGAAKPFSPTREQLAGDLERFYAGNRDRPAMEARGHDLSYRDWWGLHNERAVQRRAWADYFHEYDLLLCPTSPSAAFRHDQGPDRFVGKIVPDSEKREDPLFWALWPGVSYLPSTVVPAGLTRSGLPCGLQIVGPHGQDALGIQFATLVEQVLGGFRRSPLLTDQ